MPDQYDDAGRELMTEAELADYLQLENQALLRTWRSQKRGPAYVRVGRLIRYRWADVQEWLECRTETPEKS